MNYGKYSDWLVASDIDGTLLNKRGKLPKRNREAVERFTGFYGGNFTLASGRAPYAIKAHYDSLPGLKCPVVVQNGAGIYDFNEQKMLWFSPISQKLQGFAAEIMRKFPLAQAEIHTLDSIYQVNPGLSATVMSFINKPTTFKRKRIEDVPPQNWAKIIFYGNPFLIRDIRSYVKLNSEVTTNFMDSSPVTYEMVNEDCNKWLTIVRLADMLGIDQKKIAVIGDHYNDYEMLKNAPISACCGQSPRGIKYVAKIQTCHCDRGAVADLLEFIESNH